MARASLRRGGSDPRRILLLAACLLSVSPSLATGLDLPAPSEFGTQPEENETLRPEHALFEGVRPLTSLLRGGDDAGPWWERAPSPAKAPAPSRPGLPVRELVLDFDSPLDHAESNARAWYSLNQLFGRGMDALGRGLGLDAAIPGRIGLLLAAAWGSGALAYYSHETAHTFEDRKVGVGSGFRVDGAHWVAPGVPRYRMEVAQGDLVLSPEEEARAVAAGLDQTALDARFLWARSTLAGARDWVGALAFLEGALDPLLQIGAGILSASPTNDVTRSVLLAREAGIPLTRRRLLAQCLVADALSLPLWEAMAAVGRFAARGDRSAAALRLPLGGGLAVAPPLFQIALSPRGPFAEGALFLLFGPHRSLELSLGRRADFQGASRVRGLRIAAEAHGWLTAPLAGATVWLTPSLAGRIGGSGALTGALAGLELGAGMAGVALTCRLETGFNDTVRHEIQGEGEGFRAVLGLAVQF